MVSCQETLDDYELPEPHCKDGKYDIDYLDDFILSRVNDDRAALVGGIQWNYQAKKKIPAGEWLTELVS